LRALARHYPIRKEADVRRVLRCEKAGRTILRGKANEATLCEPCALYLYGDWLPACIAKVIGSLIRRVTSKQRSAFEGLEPYEGKLSRTVLRGERGRKAPDLPGNAPRSSRLVENRLNSPPSDPKKPILTKNTPLNKVKAISPRQVESLIPSQSSLSLSAQTEDCASGGTRRLFYFLGFPLFVDAPPCEGLLRVIP
jgi:hypothetical protein